MQFIKEVKPYSCFSLHRSLLTFGHPEWETANNLYALNIFRVAFSLVMCAMEGGGCVFVLRRGTRRSEFRRFNFHLYLKNFFSTKCSLGSICNTVLVPHTYGVFLHTLECSLPRTFVLIKEDAGLKPWVCAFSWGVHMQLFILHWWFMLLPDVPFHSSI